MNEKMKVHVMQCGSVTLPSSALFYEDGAHYPLCMITYFNRKEKLLHVPAFTFLIEHPNGKKILYDTAWSGEVRTKPWRNMAASHLVDNPSLPEGQKVDEQLKNFGVEPSDLDYVILSHMHIDHAGGVKEVRQAKHIMTSKKEWDVAKNGGIASYRKNCWDDVYIETFEYQPMGIGPIGMAKDLFGDGSVLLVATPGHTPGHTSILLRNNGRELLLSGDNGYARKSWRDGILPGLMKDPENMTRSLNWVKEYVAGNDALIDVISDHETELDTYDYEF